jgi:hypothetical protein
VRSSVLRARSLSCVTRRSRSRRLPSEADLMLPCPCVRLPSCPAAFMGQMADIRVWSVARTDDQIRQSYKTTVPANAEVRFYLPLVPLLLLPRLRWSSHVSSRFVPRGCSVWS